ncbi:hypothetical protein [Roseinatronobacter bogoriensis]|uniref:Uncharacterized protein n=1 Tax=Roseinatronobacter bogoriensis subsp. barguzinensis TaxID=441209 RepID=A0A2K8K4Q8_9RHOB|nr:hypothetical protein [Rhodobaca]ATX64444.1 hypothetical protein BG454_00190 [Rhodobaca barguzinensis]MBB4209150.1 hypothetical protein [Rhodobaca bogoriensis DSM 18756]TDW36322.1 hypothetical protein LY39_02870 [Rhodobaca barguzinensis]TDY67550.1 hypothetical protein EV660_10763 [Rhodobaca bogoriensis DSM 18756]
MSKDVDHIGTFTGPEIEQALSLPDRTFEMLKREGNALPQVTQPARGRLARYSFAALSRLNLARKLAPLAGGVVPAARIASAIGPELEARYGSTPYGFAQMQYDLQQANICTDTARGPDGEFCHYRLAELLWRAGKLDETRPRTGDFILVIIDSDLVASGNWDGLGYALRSQKKPFPVQPMLRFTRAGRTIEIEDMEAPEKEAYFCDRVERADTILQVNVGLSLRRALVHIIKTREAST